MVHPGSFKRTSATLEGNGGQRKRAMVVPLSLNLASSNLTLGHRHNISGQQLALFENEC